MAGRYKLRLREIPDETRNDVVEAARLCGPPLDRKVFNSVLIGQESLPAIIAEDDDRGRIAGLRQILEDAGAKLELIGDGGGSSSSLLRGPKGKLIIGAGVFLVLLLIGALLTNLFKTEDPVAGRAGRPHVSTATVSTSSVATSSTATVSAARPRIESTAFRDFMRQVAPPEAECPKDTPPFVCALSKFRKFRKSPPALPRTATVSQAVSHDEFTKVLSYQFVRCLADEGDAPKLGEENLVPDMLKYFAPLLTRRPGQTDCTIDRSTMYDCVTAMRNESCRETHARVNAALVYTATDRQVSPWQAAFAGAAESRILECLRIEKSAWPTSMEETSTRLLGLSIADDLEKSNDQCSQEDFVDCSRSISAMSCQELQDALATDAKTLITRLAKKCPSLNDCR